jgi:hypothetical protein
LTDEGACPKRELAMGLGQSPPTERRPRVGRSADLRAVAQSLGSWAVLAPGDLYSLLGVQADIGDDNLRRAYEVEVSRAVRAGHQRRVLQLSAALDALPDGRRGVLYPGHRHVLPRVGAAPHGSWRSWEPPSPTVPAVRARGGRRRPFLRGALTGLSVAALLTAGVLAYVDPADLARRVTGAAPRVVSRLLPADASAHHQPGG